MKDAITARNPLAEFTLKLSCCDADIVYHSLRVGQFAKKLLERYVSLYDPDIEYTPTMLEWAATLHDIGKQRVNLDYLLKEGKLTAEEMQKTKQHVKYGEDILKKYNSEKNRILYDLAHDVILYHHERADGKGYLSGIDAEHTPLSAQIVALADCFDALIGARPYKPPLPVDAAIEMINAGKCGAFSPDILACLPVLSDV